MAAPIKQVRGKRKTPKPLPNISLESEKQHTFEKSLKKNRRKTEESKTGVIYLGNIPHGFFEWDMRNFFSQFGNVKRIRLSRSKKTGRSKGYAFIEFEYESVAKVVAETMNNYLMFERLLKCQMVDNPHPDMFKGSEKKFSKPKAHLIAINRHNNVNEENKEENTINRFNKKNKKLTEKLKALGIDFTFSPSDSKKLEQTNKEEGSSLLKEAIPKQKPAMEELTKVVKKRKHSLDNVIDPIETTAEISSKTSPKKMKTVSDKNKDEETEKEAEVGTANSSPKESKKPTPIARRLRSRKK